MGTSTKNDVQSVSENQSSTENKPKKKSGSQYDCKVQCLDGTVVDAVIEKSAKGEILFNKVIEELRITSKEYTGLMFYNEKKLQVWLDIHKDMKHQIGDCQPSFFFKVKFYETEPSRLKDEHLRYLLYMQLREEIGEGRLLCSSEDYISLGAYTAQAELGDFNLHEHDHNYLNDYQFAPDQNDEFLQKVNDLHKSFRGQTPEQAELGFLDIAKSIPRYGVSVHDAQDGDGPVEIGVAPLGVNIYRNGANEKSFKWNEIADIVYNRRKFTVKLKEPNPVFDSKKKSHNYFFSSARSCKECYKTCVEYHTFYRLTRPSQPRRKVDRMSLGSSFRYSDRTLYQLRNDGRPLEKSPFKKPPSTRSKQERKENSCDDDYDDDKNDPKKTDQEEKPVVDDIEIDESNPEDGKYPSYEWKVVEKPQPDGTKKRYRKRLVIIKYLKRPEDLVNENEVTIEDVEFDENQNPTEEKFDPDEWEVVEKPEPDGSIKKYRRRIFVIKIIRRNLPDGEEPVDEKECKVEEVDVDEFSPEEADEMYTPEEWEPFERESPDGKVKRYRRRLYIMKAIKKPSPDNDQGVNYEEEEITEENPDDPQKYDPEEWEKLAKTQPDGTVKYYRRRIVVVKIVNKQQDDSPKEEPIPAIEILEDQQQPDLFNALEEYPKYEEFEMDEKELKEFENDPEWEIVEKQKPDGTTIRVRRRHIQITIQKKPHMIVTVRPPAKKHELDEELNEELNELPYEEIEIDENNPDHDKYDPSIWEVLEKVDTDGSVKKFRRRYISTCNVLLKMPSHSSSKSKTHYEEIEIDEGNPDDLFNANEWEVVVKEQPDGSVKRYRRRLVTTTMTTTYTTTRYIIQTDGDEEMCMENKPIDVITSEVDGKPVSSSEQIDVDDLNAVDMSMDDLLSEINEMSMSFDDSLKRSEPVQIAPITVLLTSAEVETSPEVETAPENFEVPLVEIDEEERRRREDEEMREKEGLNATIDSIFTLPDDEEVSRNSILHSRNSYDDPTFNESLDNELAEYGVEPMQDAVVSSFEGIVINIKPAPKTAPKPQKKHKQTKPTSEEGPELTVKIKEPDSNSDDNVSPCFHGHSNDQDCLLIHDGKSEIIYTVTDVSQVEQGRGGFVSAIKAKHETLANEESDKVKRNSHVFDSPPNTPKGHVPTRTISFNENDKPVVVKTKAPPSVPAKPTVIVPDESELPEEVLFESQQMSQDESYPDLEVDVIEESEIPEVQTAAVIFEAPLHDDIQIVPVGCEPGIVETKPLDTHVIKTEIIEVDLTPRQMEMAKNGDKNVLITTEHLPTEVITKTITIEGDSTNLTTEEIQKLLNEAPEEVSDLESLSSTKVVRTTQIQKVISGKKVTVSGDEIDDVEVQRLLAEALANGDGQTTVTDEDGNIIITAVRQESIEIDENGDTHI